MRKSIKIVTGLAIIAYILLPILTKKIGPCSPELEDMINTHDDL